MIEKHNQDQVKSEKVFAAILLLSVLVVLYSLVYSGTFLTDDEHILASQSISYAFDGRFSLSRIIGNSRVFALSLLKPVQAIEAVNIEPAQALIGVWLIKLSVWLGTGRVQTLFVQNIWVTALTAMVIFLTATLLGCSKKIGFILLGLFGVATIAFPYSRTYFRDPLAMFFLACAWLFARRIASLSINNKLRGSKIWLWLGFAGFSVAGILAKNTVIIAVPIMLLEILANRKKGNKSANSKKVWIKVGIGLVCACALLLVWFLVIPKIPLLARFTPSYYWSLFKFFLSTPRPNFWQAIIGPFISPGKSIFLFSPVLLISLWSLIFHFRSSWSAWLYLILLVIFQALFYDADWAGHTNWGIRYILPALPALILASRDTIEEMIRGRKGRVVLVIIVSASVIIQLLGAVTPVKQYFIEKAGSIPAVNEYSMIWQAKQSILLWSMNWILAGKPVDLAIGRNLSVLWLILPMIAIIGVLWFFFWKEKFKWIPILSIIAIIGMDFGMLKFYKFDPDYYFSRTDFRQSQELLISQVQRKDLVLIKSYATPVWYYWMNWDTGDLNWTSLPFAFPTPSKIQSFGQSGNPADALDEITLVIFEKEITPGRKIWLVTPSDTPGAELGWESLWLEQRAEDSECQLFIDNNLDTKLCWYLIKAQ